MSKRGTLAERLIRIPLLLMQREWSQQELIREFGEPPGLNFQN